MPYSRGQSAARPRSLPTRAKKEIAADTSLVIADSGFNCVVTADGKIITLPSTVIGMHYRIENGAADGTAAVNVSPAAIDKIQGNGLTPADNKDLINTKATAKKGDFVLLAADGVDGWFIVEKLGIWAREA